MPIEKGSSKKFVGWKRVDVGDIALLAPAELDAKRVDQNEMPDTRDGADAHFERDPSAERRTDDHDIAEALPLEQIEIEIGEIVDGTKPVGPFRGAEPRMPRRDD